MASVIVNDEYITAIANAIREKSGEYRTYKLADMADAILALPMDGGNSGDINALIEGTATEYNNNTLTAICNHAFYKHPSLINFSGAIMETIGEYAFAESALQSIYGPSVKTIGAYSFEKSAVNSIDFPLSTDIKNYAFNECAELTTVNLLSAAEIRNGAFKKCTALEYIYLPKVERIWQSTFNSCSNLTKVDLGVYIWKIDSSAFQSCTNLTTVILRNPDTVCNFVGSYVFYNTPIASGEGYIYVPRALVEDYEEQVSSWVDYSVQIRAIEDYPEICGIAEEAE